MKTSYTERVLKAARRLYDLGFWIVPIRAKGEVRRRKNPRFGKDPDAPEFLETVCKGKEPIGYAWGVRRWIWAKIESTIRAVPGRGYGICLGPGRGPNGEWLIDAEGDNDQAEASWAALCGGEVVETIGWGARRGKHRLLIVDGKRFLELLRKAGAKLVKKENQPGVWHLEQLPGLELRIGGVKKDGEVLQLQSVAAPCLGEDDQPRKWLPGKTLATTPKAAYAHLATLARSRYGQKALEEETSLFASKPAGERHPFLCGCTMRLASLVKAEALTEREALAGLHGAAHRNGLDGEGRGGEVDELWESAMAKVGPRDIKEANYGAPPSRNGDGGGDADQRPIIFVTTEEAEVNDQAVKVLAGAPGLYQRDFRLVAVARDSRPKQAADIRRAEGAPVIRPVQAARLREELTRIIRWQALKSDRNGEALPVNTHPPAWCVAAIQAREEWPEIPYLVGVVEAPTLRADGSILERPGYDPRTALLYIPNGSFPPVPANPSQADARTAADLLFKLVKDFPFKEGHKAAWLAALLTPLGRFLIDGPCPLFLFEANTSAAGKSKLCDLIGVIVAGREMTRTGYYHDSVEMDKQITATALAGDRVVFLDNIQNGGELGNSSLDRALTGRTYRGRVLGKLEMTPDLDLISVFYATGNNLSLCGDTPRRILPGRLESPLEHPEERDDFSIKECPCGCGGDLIEHARRDRGRLHAAALTILRAYIQAGKPPQSLKPMDFPAWSGLIRNAVYWTTGLDPAIGRPDLRKADSHHEHCAAFVEAWRDVQDERGARAMTTADLVRELASGKQSKAYDSMRAAISDLWPKLKPGDLPSSGTIGNTIGAIRDKPFGHLKFRASGSEDRRKLWAVVNIHPIGAADESDESDESIPDSSRENCADTCQRGNFPSDNCQRSFAGGSGGETHQTHQTHPAHRDLDPNPY
jgi:hypothetical protein